MPTKQEMTEGMYVTVLRILRAWWDWDYRTWVLHDDTPHPPHHTSSDDTGIPVLCIRMGNALSGE